MSTEADVTFVGGKAVEQSEPLDSNLDEGTREDALAAVREAIKSAGQESAEAAKSAKAKNPYKPAGTESDGDEDDDRSGTPPRGPDGKFLPKDGEEPKASPKGKQEPEKDDSEEELDPDKASVKQLLKQREKVANLKREAKDEITRERVALQQEQAKLQQTWSQLQQMQAQLQRQQEALHALRKDPARAIREIGYDPEQFIMDLATEGTPEGQARRKQQEIDAQLAEIRAWKEQQAQAAQKAQEEAYMRQAAAYRHKAVNDFLSLGLNEEKFPHVANFYKGREKALVAYGDIIAEEFRNLSGREGDYSQILDYIEDELAEASNSWYSKRGQGSQKVDSAPPAAKKSAGKSLSPEQSGERRALAPKDLTDLDNEERHEAAKMAVKVALAASRNS